MRSATAYFGPGIELSPLIARLSTIGAGLVLGTSEVEEEPWVETQERSRKPLAIGRRFLILQRSQETCGDSVGHASSHASKPPGSRVHQEARIVLVIPPRRAFGTGEHATTRQCLELLESTHVEGRAVLDAGTGSGILAMAAAVLGASPVTAIDNDPEAVEIARETLALNGSVVERAIDLRLEDLSSLSGRFSVILANIHAGVLEAAAATLAALQSGGDHLILSGFSPEEASNLGRLYAGLGYDQEARLESGEWAALRLTRTH